MKTVILILVAILCPDLLFAQSPSFAFAISTGDTGSDIATAMATDAQGNLYVTGSFSDAVDFNPGPGVDFLISTGISDVYVTKLDSSGNFIWARRMGGSADDYSSDISVDAAGNILVYGGFSGTADFDGQLSLTSAGGRDIYLWKLDGSGNTTWTKRIGGIVPDYATDMKTDAAGNIFMTGSISDTVDVDPGANVFKLATWVGGNASFIVKLDAGGNFSWAKQLGFDYTVSLSLSIDPAANVITTGVFQGTEDFNPGAGIFDLTSPIGAISDVFVCKLDSSGNFLWVQQLGGVTDDRADDVVTDRLGNVYVTGYFTGTADFDPGPATKSLTALGNDVFVCKLDAGGHLAWAKAMGGPNQERAYSIALDTAGAVYTVGNFADTADFDPGAGIVNLTPAAGSTFGMTDMFISKLDTAGNFVWAGSIGGPLMESGLLLHLDKGSIYVGGGFSATADLDPGPAVYSLTSAGVNDAFIVKLHAAGNVSVAPSPVTTNGLSLYPNPVSTLATVSSRAELKDAIVRVITIQGQLMESRTVSGHQFTIDLSARPPGTYLVEVRSQDRVEWLRLGKQ